MNQTQIGSFENIPLAAIRPSTTNPRKHFDPAALDELTNSVRELGVTVPIHVRAHWHDGNLVASAPYEIVTGERRFRAAKAAGLEAIPAIVHGNMEDEAAMDLQLVENLQRADLHPVEEAEGYRALMAHGESAEDVAKKAGKTLGYVQQRLKLLSLEVDAKQLFAEGHLTLGHALLLARLTPADQEKALLFLLGIGDWELDKKLTTSQNIAKRRKDRERNERAVGTLLSRLIDPTEANLKDWIQSHVLLQLKTAPWDLGDAELLPIAGPCTACPKRTGANAALFADITTNEDTCTDGACYADKMKAFTARAQHLAKEQGSPLLKISAKESTEKLEKPAVEIRASAVKMQGDKAVETKRAVVVATKPVKQGQWVAAKKGSCPSTVQGIAVDGAEQGKTKWVCPDQSCKVHPRHVSKPQERTNWQSMNQNSPDNRAKREAEEKIEQDVEAAILKALETVDAKKARMLEYLLVETFDKIYATEDLERICERLDISIPRAKSSFDPKRQAALREGFDKWVCEATLPELHDAALWLLVVGADDYGDHEELNKIAKRAGIDPDGIEKVVRAKFEADAKAEAKAKPAKPATPAKKAAKKKGGK